MTAFPLSPERILEVTEKEARSRATGFINGVLRYVKSDKKRTEKDYEVIWRSGSCRLLKLHEDKTHSQTPLILIPSLINKWYILDLTPETSLTDFLVQEGHPVYVVDWGIPGSDELYFDLSAYIAVYLTAIVRLVAERHGGKVLPIGYCMGGVLALGLASLLPEFLKGLVLLATPWDFRTPDSSYPHLPPAYGVAYEQWIEKGQLFPGEWMALFFYLLDPWRFENKFIQFSKIPDDIEAAHFVAIEQWVNDCVPLTKGVAKNCLIDWTLNNKLAQEEWYIMKRAVEPKYITAPTLIVAPQHDTVVPPTSAHGLAAMMPNTTLLEPPAGHVGMLVGKHRAEHLLTPLRTWLGTHA
ncbi:MAG: alpha/beta fold hydrolase [Rickettsiales bacterium]